MRHRRGFRQTSPTPGLTRSGAPDDHRTDHRQCVVDLHLQHRHPDYVFRSLQVYSHPNLPTTSSTYKIDSTNPSGVKLKNLSDLQKSWKNISDDFMGIKQLFVEGVNLLVMGLATFTDRLNKLTTIAEAINNRRHHLHTNHHKPRLG